MTLQGVRLILGHFLIGAYFQRELPFFRFFGFHQNQIAPSFCSHIMLPMHSYSNNNNSYIALYPIKIYELSVLYMISYVIGFVLNMYLLVAKHYDEDFVCQFLRMRC